MSGRFFLDTNIFVYSFDARAPKKAAQATRLIRRGIDTRGGIHKDVCIEKERSEEHTSELQSRLHLVCRLLLEKKKTVKHLRSHFTRISVNRAQTRGTLDINGSLNSRESSGINTMLHGLIRLFRINLLLSDVHS